MTNAVSTLAAAMLAATALSGDPPSATPRDWYVDAAVATTGVGTAEAPFLTIGEAVAKAATGDTVRVAPGEYSESFQVSSDVALSIVATDGAATTSIAGELYGYAAWEPGFEAAQPSLVGFTMRGAVVQGMTLRDCLLTCDAMGVYPVQVFGCRLADCAAAGNESDESLFYQCELVRCTVAGNTVGFSAVGSGSVVLDSIVWGNATPGGSAANLGDGVAVTNSCTFPLPDDAQGRGVIDDDPRLVDAANGDLRVRAGSPCVANGVQTMGARLDDPVEGFVLSVRVEGTGSVAPMTAIVAEGGDATFTATATTRPFLGFATNDIDAAAGPTLTWPSVTADGIVTASFSNYTFHVDAATGDDANDGLSWETAKQTLQAAVDEAESGETVQAKAGTYAPIATDVARRIYIEGVDGKAATVIDGGGLNRCADLGANGPYGSTMVGFTLANGSAPNGGGACGGTLGECDIVGCSAYLSSQYGTQHAYGGGLYGSVAVRCAISNCVADTYYGNGIAGAAAQSELYTCLVVGNYASWYAGGAAACTLVGCTVAANTAWEVSGGIDSQSLAVNTILWGNYTGDGMVDFEDDSWGTSTLLFCCAGSAAQGTGNIAADPRFLDTASGDYRLRTTSPCLDAGSPDFFGTALDLPGNDRIQGEAPDMGAFEGAGGSIPLQLALPEDLWFSALAQTGHVGVVGDTTWSVVPPDDDDWLGITDVITGTGDMPDVPFTLALNDTGATRTARLVIEDATGAAVTQTVHQAAATAPPTLPARYYGLFVGVSQYARTMKVQSLAGCVPDATRMCNRFTNWGYCARDDAVLLTNSRATLTAVRSTMADLAAKAVAGDTVLFYHSSHGTWDSSAGTKVGLVDYNGTYWDYLLAEDLGRFADGVRVVVMADTCHSGGLFKSTGKSAERPRFDLAARVQAMVEANRAETARPTRTTGAGRLGAAVPRNLSSPADIGWVTAADYDQYSWDMNGGGAFTIACLDGWATGSADSDGDGRVSFYDLWLYARNAGEAPATVDGGVTEAQCLNEEILLDVLAGVTDASTAETETFGSPLRVPHAWLDDWMPGLGYAATSGGFYTHAAYEVAANGTKKTPDGATMAVWQDYLAGTCPTNPSSVFLATIALSNGVPVVGWEPDLGAERAYRVLGRESLSDGAWGPTNAASRFFKVEVGLP